jgi:hypothetical protein
MPVIPVIQKVEVRRIMVQGWSQTKSLRLYPKITKTKKGLGACLK